MTRVMAQAIVKGNWAVPNGQYLSPDVTDLLSRIFNTVPQACPQTTLQLHPPSPVTDDCSACNAPQLNMMRPSCHDIRPRWSLWHV